MCATSMNFKHGPVHVFFFFLVEFGEDVQCSWCLSIVYYYEIVLENRVADIVMVILMFVMVVFVMVVFVMVVFVMVVFL